MHGNVSGEAEVKDVWKDATPPPKVDLSYSSKDYKSVRVNTSTTGTDQASGIAKYVFEYKESTASDWTTAIEQTSLPSSYEYTGLAADTEYNFRVTTVDNAGNGNSTGTNINQTTNQYVFTEADVGKKVNYTPKAGQRYWTDGFFLDDDDMWFDIETSGTNTVQKFLTDDYSGGWSLWNADNNNIYVISTSVTAKPLLLKGARGYNNGVTLLDKICDNCFTDKTNYPDMTGRNLKLEDVLDVKASSIANNNTNYGEVLYSYSFKYPYIWNQYEKTQNNSIANRSTAYPLTDQDTLTSSITYRPYSTCFYSNSMNASSAWTNATYFGMVMIPAEKEPYWLSSRCVWPSLEYYCSFGLQYVDESGIKCSGLYDFGRSLEEPIMNYAVRPMIMFPTSTYRLEPNGEAFDIVKK